MEQAAGSLGTQREVKKLWKEFRGFTDYVQAYLTMLDQAMKEPEGLERGRRLAKLANELNLKNDCVRRFTLNLDFNGRPRGSSARRAPRSRGKHPG